MQNKIQLCKRVQYKIDSSPTPAVVLGVLSEQNGFVIVQTAKRKIMLRPEIILSIEDTAIPFQEARP